MRQTFRVVLTGGGSGGHVYPLIAIAEELQRLAAEYNFDLEIKYYGPSDEYNNLFAGLKIRTSNIVSGKLRRYFSVANIFDVPKFFVGLIQALFKIYWFMPDVVFSKGGTGALSVVLASRFYRIPIMIHESDATPGLNNLLSGRFAKRIAVTFESALAYFNPKKTAVTGTPVRRELTVDRVSKERAKEELGFNAGEPLTLILGGSLGSERINEFILANLENLVKETQILHQTGQANLRNVEKLSRAAMMNIPLRTEIKSRYLPVSYLMNEKLKNAFTAADLVISRAGSGTISEIAAFGVPAILIPLRESAGNHQRLNAYEYGKTGAAIVIEEENFLPGIFMNQVRAILKNPDVMEKMSQASIKFFKPDAARIIAEEILRIA